MARGTLKDQIQVVCNELSIETGWAGDAGGGQVGLRKENERLRAQVADLRAGGGVATPGKPRATPPASPSRTPVAAPAAAGAAGSKLDSLKLQAKTAVRSGEYAAAVEAYTAALAVAAAADQPALRLNRSQCLFKVNNFEASLADAIKATQANPKSWKGWASQAQAQMQLMDFKAAQTAYSHALGLNPRNGDCAKGYSKAATMM